MSRPFISLCMIVRNEGPYLKRCLQSLDGAYDELIVVDTGSTDDTVAIAREFEARVEHFDWCDDFAAARNHACSFAEGEWIFMVDGDEYLAPEGSGPLLPSLLRSSRAGIDKVLVEQRTLLADDEDLTVLVDRIFRNRPELRWKYRIHEVIETTAEQTAMTREFYLLHENALKRRDDMRVSEEREEMYLRALQLDAEDQPQDPRPVFYLAGTLYGAGRYEEALEHYERYFRLSHGRESTRRAIAFRDAAAAAAALGDHDRQRGFLFRSLEHDWRPAETYVALADLAMVNENRAEAVHWLQVATFCEPPPTGAFASSAAYGPVIWERLATIHGDAGDDDLARQCTARAAQLRKTATPKKRPSSSRRKGKKKRSKRRK